MEWRPLALAAPKPQQNQLRQSAGNPVAEVGLDQRNLHIPRWFLLQKAKGEPFGPPLRVIR